MQAEETSEEARMVARCLTAVVSMPQNILSMRAKHGGRMNDVLVHAHSLILAIKRLLCCYSFCTGDVPILSLYVNQFAPKFATLDALVTAVDASKLLMWYATAHNPVCPYAAPAVHQLGTPRRVSHTMSPSVFRAITAMKAGLCDAIRILSVMIKNIDRSPAYTAAIGKYPMGTPVKIQQPFVVETAQPMQFTPFVGSQPSWEDNDTDAIERHRQMATMVWSSELSNSLELFAGLGSDTLHSADEFVAEMNCQYTIAKGQLPINVCTFDPDYGRIHDILETLGHWAAKLEKCVGTLYSVHGSPSQPKNLFCDKYVSVVLDQVDKALCAHQFASGDEHSSFMC